jgi:exosome complex RNA-binding protein Rrp42 (RNase PH superfamily)
LLKDLPISLVEREFVRECEKVTTRHDNRGHEDFRDFDVQQIGENNYMGIIGDTKVAVSIQSLPFKPERGRQNRGDVVVELTYMPCASRANMDIQINRNRVRNEEALQTLFRSAGVIDTRFLLIEQYEAALQLIIRVQVINDAGGVLDAALPTAVVALANYKVPKHKYEDGVFKKISTNAEWPDKLRIFTHAYVITFGVFGETFIYVKHKITTQNNKL